MKITALGVDSRVVIPVREFILGHLQRVRVGGQLSEEVRVLSGYCNGAYWAHFCSSGMCMLFGGTWSRLLNFSQSAV